MDLISPALGTIIWIIISSIIVILLILTIIHILTTKRLTERGKFIFIILVIIIPILGSIIYFNLLDKEKIYK